MDHTLIGSPAGAILYQLVTGMAQNSVDSPTELTTAEKPCQKIAIQESHVIPQWKSP